MEATVDAPDAVAAAEGPAPAPGFLPLVLLWKYSDLARMTAVCLSMMDFSSSRATFAMLLHSETDRHRRAGVPADAVRQCRHP
jgi:hypothetical protein